MRDAEFGPDAAERKGSGPAESNTAKTLMATLSSVNLVYGSLTTAIVVLLSLEVLAGLLLLGAQVISEYERIEKDGLQNRVTPFHT
jgi:hypothetical protein